MSPPLRIVIVEDHPIVRRGLVKFLEAQELTVVGEAADGASAIEEVKRHQPHLVLMDYNLPGMNGLEATRQIHADFPGIPIIGFSMHEKGSPAEIAMKKAGAVAYVSKNEHEQELASTIRIVAAQNR